MSAEEALTNLSKGAKFGNVKLNEVEDLLANEQFSSADGLLATTQSGKSTLLHLAAQTQGDAVLPLVCQAYKRAKLFSEAALVPNKSGLTPIHVAIKACRFENTVLLFKECQDNCPKAIEPNENGWTLLHSAASNGENLNILKYLLSQECCKALVLCKGLSSGRSSASLPQDIARDTVVTAEFQLRAGIDQLERFTKQAKLSSFARDSQSRTMVDPKKKVLEKARELYNQIEQITLELKAKEAEKRVRDLEQSKAQERRDNLKSELDELLKDAKWESVESKYLLSDNEETSRMTVDLLVSSFKSEGFVQPQLTRHVMRRLANFLSLEDSDPALLSTLNLLECYSRQADSVCIMLSTTDVCVLSLLAPHLSTLDTNIQSVVTSLMLNIVSNDMFKAENYPNLSSWLEALHLLKHFSTSTTVRRLCIDVLVRVGTGQSSPDPGTWSVQQVSQWLDSISELDRRAQYIEEFKKAGIDGLHLLELSASEMGGLGVKFVSHQRRLADKIDELRRMNARSIVGYKDVFLSYAHININYARRIKTVLSNSKYSVWIDEAGIRAGQKWRNEIADGIQGCGVFLLLLSKRSANSQYCQNEVAMAETYSKPIVTVRIEDFDEVDPGLQFIIGRRQWLDFTQEGLFETNSKSLVKTMVECIGQGKDAPTSPTHNEKPLSPVQTHAPDSPPMSIGNAELAPALSDQFDKLRTVMEASLNSVFKRMDKIEMSLDELAARVSNLEQIKQTV